MDAGTCPRTAAAGAPHDLSQGLVHDELVAYTEAPEGWWQEFVSAVPARTGKLAVVRRDGSPHVAPVWAILDVTKWSF